MWGEGRRGEILKLGRREGVKFRKREETPAGRKLGRNGKMKTIRSC